MVETVSPRPYVQQTYMEGQKMHIPPPSAKKYTQEEEPCKTILPNSADGVIYLSALLISIHPSKALDSNPSSGPTYNQDLEEYL
jgi:hypothetical protein